jgi:hypothetical protein
LAAERAVDPSGVNDTGVRPSWQKEHDRILLEKRPLSKPNEMSALWRELGFLDVEQTSLLIRMEFSCFDDYWLPFTRGEGPPGQFVAGLSDAARSTLTEHLRRAYLANLPDGPRSFACVAWACRGTVPS